MCGRYVSVHTADEVAEYFSATPAFAAELPESYNVAPTNDIYSVLVREGTRQLTTMRWGLIPPWAKDAKTGLRMINARAETLAERNSYRGPFKRRRCLIPADGFYEWVEAPGQKAKQPVYITRSDGETMAFAGLWERWQPGDKASKTNEGASTLLSAVIVTGQANEKISEVHHRMPIVLPPAAWDEWLDPANNNTQAIGRLLLPAPSELFSIHPVSTEVNNPRTKGEHLIRPV